MKVKVTLEKLIIDQENVAIQEGDIKIEGTKLIMSYPFYQELSNIFELIEKGLVDFESDFEFKL